MKHSQIKPRRDISPSVLRIVEQLRACVWKYDTKWAEKDGDWESSRKARSPRDLDTFPWKESTGAWARSLEQNKWGTFDEAMEAYGESQQHDEYERMQGIGFVIESDRPISVRGHQGYLVYVDLDNCRDPETGKVESWALQIVKITNTYTEISPSGTGLRLIAYVTEPIGAMSSFLTPDGNSFVAERDVPKEERKNHRKVEVYGGGSGGKHLITFTGCALEGYDLPVNDVPQWMANLPTRQQPSGNDLPVAPEPVHSSDEEVLTVIRRSEDANLMHRFFEGDQSLWEGSNSPYDTRSEADQAFLEKLAFYARGDAQRIKRIALTSRMRREKWERDDYWPVSIEAAIRFCEEHGYYDPSAMRNRRREIVERLYERRMNESWRGWDECYLYLADLSLAYYFGKLGRYEDQEGIFYDAPARNRNLLSGILMPESNDHSRLSKVWRRLEKDGYIRLVERGKGAKSSRYFLPVEPGNDGNLNELATQQESMDRQDTADNPTKRYTTAPAPLCLSLCRIICTLEEDEPEDNFMERATAYRVAIETDAIEANAVEAYGMNGTLEVDSISGRLLPFYLKIIWLPQIRKKQRFILEQIIHGRDTFDSLHEYFGGNRYSFIRRHIAQLKDKLGLIVEEEANGDSRYRVSVDGVERLFEEGGRDNLERYLSKIEDERRVYSEYGEKANEIRTLKKILDCFKGEIENEELTEYEKLRKGDFVWEATVTKEGGATTEVLVGMIEQELSKF